MKEYIKKEHCYCDCYEIPQICSFCIKRRKEEEEEWKKKWRKQDG